MQGIRIGPVELTSAPATIYTVPASDGTWESFFLKHLRVVSEWPTFQPVTASIGADGAGTRILNGQPIAPNDVLEWEGLEVLKPGDLVQAYASPPGVLGIPRVFFAGGAGAGGSLAAATYYYVVTAENANGETIASPEVQLVTAVNNENVLYWSQVLGATKYRIYRGTAAGGENVYYEINAPNVAAGQTVSFTDTGAAPTGNAAPPAANTATVPLPTLTASGALV